MMAEFGFPIAENPGPQISRKSIEFGLGIKEILKDYRNPPSDCLAFLSLITRAPKF